MISWDREVRRVPHVDDAKTLRRSKRSCEELAVLMRTRSALSRCRSQSLHEEKREIDTPVPAKEHRLPPAECALEGAIDIGRRQIQVAGPADRSAHGAFIAARRSTGVPSRIHFTPDTVISGHGSRQRLGLRANRCVSAMGNRMCASGEESSRRQHGQVGRGKYGHRLDRRDAVADRLDRRARSEATAAW
jgi:hypothetical protein